MLFSFTDIHGMYELYKAIIDYCQEQDPEYSLIFLGDACDRGPDGYKIMKELLQNSHVVYLKGNHEDLFVNAARELINKNKFTLNKDNTAAIQLALDNGGYDTLHNWILDGANIDFVNRIAALPLTATYKNIDFCHAGGLWKIFKEVNDAECAGIMPSTYAAEKCIWDRDWIALGWGTGRICIHGHTPTTYLPNGIYWRDKSSSRAHPCAWQDKMGGKQKRGGWKIDMDTGAAFTKIAYVLDVEKMQAQGFKYKDNQIEKIEVIQF